VDKLSSARKNPVTRSAVIQSGQGSPPSTPGKFQAPSRLTPQSEYGLRGQATRDTALGKGLDDQTALRHSKAPSPLRFAGAVQDEDLIFRKSLESTDTLLDCGGKRSATPLFGQSIPQP
jgi:hypothetical protein